MNRFFAWLMVAWFIVILVLGLALTAVNSCESEACNGWWFLLILVLPLVAIAGLVIVPLGLWGAADIARERRERGDVP